MSTNESNIAPHAAWKPHHITAVDTTGECTGFIGRTVATVLGGVEVVLHARNVDDLATAWGVISNKPLDEERIYKGTLIQSDRVEIEVVETPPEVDVPETPAEEPTDTGVTGEQLAAALTDSTERVGPGQIDYEDEEL